ncbi:FAD-binding oxidoreductase [Mucilaginibacter sp.]|uniref:FAD-binding oxidoreductase n=1 Tax=Mucilaginibacter sp. TaxID=1882438 RepID=UPI003D12A268
MEKHIVKVLKTEFVTHNVKRFTLERPKGYTFVSGQATDVSINKPELTDELRPFTLTSLNSDDHLEFTIKIYTGHNGITEKLLNVNVGDELIVHEVFGTINYHDKGLFIAGGAGITPFISIFRELTKQKDIAGNVLLFANRTEKDIILKDELDAMLGENHIDVLSDQSPGKTGKHIDRQLLKQYTGPQIKNYYICGPDEFVSAIKEDLIELQVPEKQIITEQ